MPRSVAELLPRRFEELQLEDVAAIIETVGDERETLFLERKAALSRNSLAKACAAFANTYGGLLIGGVADDDPALTGMQSVGQKAQLWVKDTLQGNLLPMPPFRARWLPTDGDRGILLVLLEQSSTTPHLLVRNGAIYVRNPGSSDPVPISDQRRLLELTERGTAAAARAQERALEMRRVYIHAELDETTYAVALAATGVAADFETRLFAPETPEHLSVTAWGPIQNPPHLEGRLAVWRQREVGVARGLHGQFAFRDGVDLAGIVVNRDGGVNIYRGYARVQNEQPRYDSLHESMLRQRFVESVTAAREILLEYGAHGDVRLAYMLWAGGRGIHFDTQGGQYAEIGPNALALELWTDFDEDVTDRVFAEVARSLGLGPRAA